MEPRKDYYALLNANMSTSTNEIKEKYRNFSYLFHPDKADSKHIESFTAIADATKILSDPLLRFVYTHYGKRGITQIKNAPDIYLAYSKSLLSAKNEKERKSIQKVGILAVFTRLD